MEPQFTCPVCGKHILEEVMGDVTVTSRITAFNIEDGTANPDYDDSSNDGGEVLFYQCANCGERLKDYHTGEEISGCESLAEWLEDHQ